MRSRTGAGVSAIAVACVLALASCSSANLSAPPPPDTQQIRALMSVWPAYEASRINSYSPATLEDVAFVRFVPDESWYTVMARCTAALGVTDITYHPDLTSSAPPTTTTQQWARDLANGSCLIEYPPESVRARLKTSAQLDYIYTYYVNELVPCMRSQGVDVHGVPSRSRFHTISQNGLRLWSPYLAIQPGVPEVKSVASTDGVTLSPVSPGSTTPRMRALLGKCPALPPGV